jgi:hypothetical protein
MALRVINAKSAFDEELRVIPEDIVKSSRFKINSIENSFRKDFQAFKQKLEKIEKQFEK